MWTTPISPPAVQKVPHHYLGDWLTRISQSWAVEETICIVGRFLFGMGVCANAATAIVRSLCDLLHQLDVVLISDDFNHCFLTQLE